MGILQSSDPQELPECLKWHYEPIKPGTHGPFMLGAPPWAGECHHPLKKTVPCLALLKGCTLPCPWCRYKRQFQCYVPYFDLQRAKRYKLVLTGGKKTWEGAKQFQVGDVFMAIRGTADRDTVLLRPWPHPLDVNSLKVMRSRITEDISPYLFHLWQYRPLTEHFRQKYRASLITQANAVPHPDALTDDSGKPIPE